MVTELIYGAGTIREVAAIAVAWVDRRDVVLVVEQLAVGQLVHEIKSYDGERKWCQPPRSIINLDWDVAEFAQILKLDV